MKKIIPVKENPTNTLYDPMLNNPNSQINIKFFFKIFFLNIFFYFDVKLRSGGGGCLVIFFESI